MRNSSTFKINAEGNKMDCIISHSLKITRWSSMSELGMQKVQWNNLIKKNETNSIFQTFEWHESWWKTYGHRYTGLILIAQSKDRILGIAPLMVSKKRVTGIQQRVVEFIGAPMGSDYCDFIIDPESSEVLDAFLKWLMDYRKNWDILQFSDIPETSNRLNKLKMLFSKTGYPVLTTTLYEAPTRLFNNLAKDQKITKKKVCEDIIITLTAMVSWNLKTA